MKKLLLLLFILPNLALAETWNCTYKSTKGSASESSTFERQGEFFTYGASASRGEYRSRNEKFKIAKEIQGGKIILVFNGFQDYIVELIYDNKVDGKIVFTDMRDLAQWKGSCSIKERNTLNISRGNAMTDGGLGIIIVLVWLVVYMIGLNLIHKDKTEKKPIKK